MKEKLNWVKSYAPGRINLIGEHTDYNQGFVLPGAIDQGVTFFIQKNHTAAQLELTALQRKQRLQFDLNKLEPTGDWPDYLLGTLQELNNRVPGLIQGFNCEFSSTIPIGAGMSSSAALGCSFALGINELFSLGLSKKELALCVQAGDHNFVGVRSGIMDQFASMLGKENQVVKLDCRSLETAYFPLELENYELLLLNTNVSHSLANSEYNLRRETCERSVELARTIFPKVESLRDISLKQLESLKSILSDDIFSKAKFVIEENERVDAMVNALSNRDLKKVGKLLYDSHEGLKNLYEVSCEELDYLVNWTAGQTEIPGARMMGGGFGGCTINLVSKNFEAEKWDALQMDYKRQFGLELNIIKVNLAEGAQILESGI